MVGCGSCRILVVCCCRKSCGPVAGSGSTRCSRLSTASSTASSLPVTSSTTWRYDTERSTWATRYRSESSVAAAGFMLVTVGLRRSGPSSTCWLKQCIARNSWQIKPCTAIVAAAQTATHTRPRLSAEFWPQLCHQTSDMCVCSKQPSSRICAVLLFVCRCRPAPCPHWTQSHQMRRS